MIDLSTLLHISQSVLIHDTLRYALGAGGVYAVVNLALRHRLRHRKIRPDSPDRRQIWREIAASLRTVLVFTLTGISIGLAERSGLAPIYDKISDYGVPWFVFSIILIIVSHDAWFYWTHRALHHPRLFRRMHRLHHRSRNPSPFAAYSFDLGEAAINALFLPIFVLLVPVHPLVLLIFVTHMMLRNAIGHCGVEVFPARRDGRPLCGWLATVTHHDLHHAHGAYNMGLYFTWWDRWMQTEHPEYLTEFARVSRAPMMCASAGVLAALMVLAAPSDVAAGELRGTYAAPGLSMVVDLAPCDSAEDRMCGRLVWAWDASELKHAQIGDVILRELTWNGSAWSNGLLTHPESGRVFRGTARQTPHGDLIVTGCAGPFCVTQHWRRLSSLRKELAALD